MCTLDFYDIGIAEIVLMPASSLILTQTIKESGFRDKFNVLGIRRKKEYLLQDLGNESGIHSGGCALVVGTWSNIARLSKEDGWC